MPVKRCVVVVAILSFQTMAGRRVRTGAGPWRAPNWRRLPCARITSIRFKGTFSVGTVSAVPTPLAKSRDSCRRLRLNSCTAKQKPAEWRALGVRCAERLSRSSASPRPVPCAASGWWSCTAAARACPGRRRARPRRPPAPLRGSPTGSTSSCLGRC